MDGSTTPTSSIRGSPLHAVTPDRANRRDSTMSNLPMDGYESPVLEKISQFNNMSTTHAKQLERKTAEAAIKRAMLGREEAEAEMRRLRDENQTLKRSVEDGKDRERKVGERLETVMDNYGRAKETHSHTQALWEKEIRRARKENFKAQSTIVKLQEELKTARTAAKINEECIEREKERSHAREQEAFTARYQIVGVQEQLEKALQRIKVVEQERDAFKTAAKNEEVARIAAEGRIPLPVSEEADEFSSPNKKLKKRKRDSVKDAPRVSLSTMEIVSSVASEMEIEELTEKVIWERQRADRAQEMVEFLQAECQMHCCPCSRSKSKSPRRSSLKRKASVIEASVERHVEQQVEQQVEEHVEERVEEHVEATVEETIEESFEAPVREPAPVEMEVEETTVKQEVELEVEEVPELEPEIVEAPTEEPEQEPEQPVRSKKERRSTIFCPKDGTFRTVSEQEAFELAAQEEIVIDEEPQADEDIDIILPDSVDIGRSTRMYARTPSVEPPSCAVLPRDRTSLQSLLSAPLEEDETVQQPTATFAIPTVDDDVAVEDHVDEVVEETVEMPDLEPVKRSQARMTPTSPEVLNSSRYKVTTTTVPVRDEDTMRSSSFAEKLRTPSSGSNASFDLNDPALTPTMTREQALAKIRERRGRARSTDKTAASAAKAKPQVRGRRDLSGPSTKPATVRGRSRT